MVRIRQGCSPSPSPHTTFAEAAERLVHQDHEAGAREHDQQCRHGGRVQQLVLGELVEVGRLRIDAERYSCEAKCGSRRMTFGFSLACVAAPGAPPPL